MLTREERKIILFLAALALIGLAADFSLKRSSKTKIVSFLSSLEIGKIELNKADYEALLIVPGIGPKLAGRIIEYRGSKGGFKSMDELMNIKGITNYRFKKMKDSFVIRE